MTAPIFFVGSSNPVKIEAVRLAVSGQWPDSQVTGIEVASGVSDQPMSDDETKQGSENRARAVLAAGLKQTPSLAQDAVALGIGLEGGVFEAGRGEMYSTVWVSVCDQSGSFWQANGARILVPQIIADRIRAGEEMGPVVQAITGEQDVRQKQGMFGVITKDFVNRTEEYSAIAKIAVGVWFGQDWQQAL
jgi:inosine/xanthosine triphosphatase